MAVSSTMYNLESLKLPQGPAHRKMERIAAELRIAKTHHKVVGAESKLSKKQLAKNAQAAVRASGLRHDTKIRKL